MEAEDRISEVEDRMVGINEAERRKIKRKEDNLRDLWDNVKAVLRTVQSALGRTSRSPTREPTRRRAVPPVHDLSSSHRLSEPGRQP